MRTVLVTAILIIVLVSSGSFALSPVSALAAPQNLSLVEWPVPTSSAGLAGVSVDVGGRVWFTENQTKLGMLDPVANKIYEWGFSGKPGRNVVTGQAAAFGGSSNRVYFAEYDNNRIGIFDNVTGTYYLTEFPVTSNPLSVFVDHQGNVWFTEPQVGGGGAIGELSAINMPSSGTPTAQLTEWTLPTLSSTAVGSHPCNCEPWGIYVNQTTTSGAPDTFVWFTELTGGTNNYGAIGRLQISTNKLNTWDLGVSPLIGIHAPTDITVDSHGNVYWVNSNPAGNSISSLSVFANTYKEYPLLTSGAVPAAPIVDAARNALWAVEYASSKIAYVDLSGFSLSTTFPPSPGQCTIGTPASGQPPKCATPAAKSAATSPSPSYNYVYATVTNVGASNSGPLGTPAGTGLYEYNLLSAGSGPFSIFLDANENLWITESSSSVNRIAKIQYPVDFNMALTSSSSQDVPQGGSVTYSISVTPAVGVQTPVALSVNAPSGLTPSFSVSPGIPPFTSTLTISATGSITPTNYPMTITGTSSRATHSVPISLTVTTQTVTTTTSTGCGFDYKVTADQTSKIIQEGSSDSYQLHVLQTCPTVSQLPVTLSVTAPTGVTAHFTANNEAPPYDTQLQVQVSIDAPVTQSATISVSGLSPARSLTLTLQITLAPREFSITQNGHASGSVSVYPSSRLDIKLTVTSIGYFSGPVNFTIPAPSVSGLSGSVSPNPVSLGPGATVTATLEIVAQKGTPTGTYQLTVTGAGNTPQGLLSHDFPVSVTVTSGLPCLIATATYGSPLAPEVQFLRDFRDHQITHTFAGSNFMGVFNTWYYSFSPAVAGYENLHPTVKAPMQFFLLPLLGSLHVSSWTYASIAALNPEMAALVAGLVASSLIGLLYLALPLAATLWLLRRKVFARGGNVKVRLVRFFAVSISMMVLLFTISELLTLPIAMMIASAAIVLLGLAAGCTIPIFALIDRFYEQ